MWGPGPTLDRVPIHTTPHLLACFQDLVRRRIVLKGFGWGDGEGDGYWVVLSSAGGPERHWAGWLDSPVPKPTSNIWVLVRPSRLVEPTGRLVPLWEPTWEKWADFLQLLQTNKKGEQIFEQMLVRSPKKCKLYKMSGPRQTRYYFVLSRDGQFRRMVGFFIFICVDASHSSTRWNHVRLWRKIYFRPSLLYAAVLFSSLGVSQNQVSASQLRHIITLFRSVQVNYDI
jgi:hypothetical protein